MLDCERARGQLLHRIELRARDYLVGESGRASGSAGVASWVSSRREQSTGLTRSDGAARIGNTTGKDPEVFRTEIMPLLVRVPTSRIAAGTA
jgi:hypothetical protein